MAGEQQSSESHPQNIVQSKLPLDSALFRISSHHTDSCGQPPAVDGDEPDKYHGYFANYLRKLDIVKLWSEFLGRVRTEFATSRYF